MPDKPTLIVVAAVIEHEGAVLVARRQAGVHLEGYWEFPGGKRDAGEDDAGALHRELREELDVDVNVGERLLETSHEYDDRIVQLRFYRCAMAGAPRAVLGQELRWVPRSTLAELTFPPADRELIGLLTTAS